MSATFSKRLHPATALLPRAPAPTYQQQAQTHNQTSRSSFESEATRTGSILTQDSLFKEGFEKPTHKESSKAKKAWEKIKKMAREHHESVNAAYQVYYGSGAYPSDWKPEGRVEEVRGESARKA
jgi:hypothetical protein